MKAIIQQHLAKICRNHTNITNVYLRGTKEELIKRVDKYIFDRVHKTNYIRVNRFNVILIKDKASQYNYQSKNVVDKWQYIPTYSD